VDRGSANQAIDQGWKSDAMDLDNVGRWERATDALIHRAG
jgi:hypothetical protein